MIAMKIFEQLKTIDNKLSLSKFSTDYLGMSRNYIFVKKHRDEDISNDALSNLYGTILVNVETRSEIIKNNNLCDISNNYLDRVRKVNQHLLEEISSEITARSRLGF
jgi:hypothetical protein